MWHMGEGWGWWMMMGWVWMVVFWGVVIWLVYSVIARLTADRPRPPHRAEPTALEILEQRYARGELSDGDFEAMRERLNRGGTPTAGGRGGTIGG